MSVALEFDVRAHFVASVRGVDRGEDGRKYVGIEYRNVHGPLSAVVQNDDEPLGQRGQVRPR